MTPAGATTTDTTLVVDKLRVGVARREVEIVDEVSFTVGSGEIVALVGESGCGKTSLGLALLGYARPGMQITGGSVTVDGVDVLNSSARKLRKLRGVLMSYVPQDPAASLNPAMRVGAQITEVLDEHGLAGDGATRGARLKELLEAVSLPSEDGFASRYSHQLSGGQQQRVAIAMAFACRPKLVVLDEPTTGLDVTTQARILSTVRELAQVHSTCAVYITHDLAAVSGLASRILVMYAGRLVEAGPAGSILSAAAHPYTRRLVAAIPDPKRRRALVGIPGRVAPPGRRSPGCGFADRCELVQDACRTEAITEQLVSERPLHRVLCRRWPATAAGADSGAGAGPRSITESSEPAALTVQGVSASYGKFQALHEVTLTIPRGHCLALVGESGSGKTTLARCISGMHAPGAGSIRLADAVLPREARARTREQLRAIQFIYQNPYGSLNPRKTVRALLEQPLKHFKRSPDRDLVPDLLNQVALGPRYASRYPAQLSGGERQRVAIARALAVSPEVLICDEITSALDVSVQASILRLLGDLHRDGSLTVMFVTHNLGVVRAVADAVVVLNQGRVVESGPVEQVLDRPSHEYTVNLMRDTPQLAAAVS